MGSGRGRSRIKNLDEKTGRMKRTFSYWEREEWLQKPDLLIIGAGIVGASVALFYKEKYPDSDVLIVDKGIVPEGASTRNAGFTCIGSISEHHADIKIAGKEVVLKRIERRWNGLRLLRKTMGEDAIDYNHTGGYEVFTDSELFESCRNQLPEMNRRLYDSLGIKDVYSETIYEGYPSIFNHVEGAINSGKLMKNLHARLARAGVRIWWNTGVKSVQNGSVLFNDGFELEADKTVIATNGFTSQLLDLPIKPARGFVFITKPIEDLKWKGTFNHNEGYVYFRNVENRLLLGGARNLAKEEETTAQFGANPKIRKYLINFANNTLKLPKGWELEMEWSGIMGVTENKEPIVREIEKGLFVAAGLSGMGIAIGMQVAKELCEKLD
jgi:gamma-glutamylputrescine oxidase